MWQDFPGIGAWHRETTPAVGDMAACRPKSATFATTAVVANVAFQEAKRTESPRTCARSRAANKPTPWPGWTPRVPLLGARHRRAGTVGAHRCELGVS